MLELSVSEWVYILSISLQLTGALLLLFKYTFVDIDKGIRENAKKETHVEAGTCFLGQTQPSPAEYTENVWFSRIAFFYIALGYLTGIWGEIETAERPVLFVLTFIFSALLSCASFDFSQKRGVRKKQQNICGDD